MKREILFKAKHQDNNQWVEGLIAYLFDTEYISQGYDDVPERKHYIVTFNQEFIEINPDTLCQFTGIADKNGNKVFDGDLLSDGVIMFEVEYNTQNTKFAINPKGLIKDGSYDIVDTIMYSTLGNGYYSRKDLEIIGNIHD